VIDQRGSTEAMIVEGGLLATIIGAYLSDDEDGRTIAVPDAEPLELGRKHDSPFFDDPFVERYHAALTLTEGGVRVDDFSEANGVYLRATGPVRLENGDRLIIGRNVLRFAALSPTPSDVLGCPNPGWWGRLDLMIGVDSHAMSHPLRLAETILGCDPEATLRFDAATGVVPTHCRIRRDASGSTFVEDLGTGPGTFIRVRSGALVPHDAQLLVGRTLIRLERLHSE
jgi:pSer/pThr/pTyr-binding forkhead associated (FHA) protein